VTTLLGLSGLVAFIGTVPAVAATVTTTTSTTSTTTTTAPALTPSAPSAMTVVPLLVHRMNLRWSAPATTVAITGYQYRVSQTADGGSTWSAYSAPYDLATVAGRRAVPCLAVETAKGGCRYVVIALSASGPGPASSPVSSLWHVPSAPRNPAVIAYRGSRVAYVSWAAPSQTGGLPQTDLLAQVSTDGGVTWSSATTSLLPAFTSSAFVLPAGCDTSQTCRVRLLAVNGAGRSPASAVVTPTWRDPSPTLGVATGTPYVVSGLDETGYWNRLAATGVGWARLDCSPLAYATITTCDDRVAQARRVGIKVLLTMAYRPPSLGGTFTATEQQQWATWAGQTAGHLTATYPGTVSGFEIWNEPNNTNFWPGADPVTYQGLLARAAFAIRASTGAPIIVGGLSPGGVNGPASATTSVTNAATFVARLYDAGGKGLFDAVGIHPHDTYSTTTNVGPPSAGWSSGFRATHWVRQVMDANGDTAKRIWATEAGTASCQSYGGYKLSDAQRANRLQSDVKDWEHGLHDPSTGATIGFGTSSDWHTGPFMVFKMYKAFDGSGFGLTYASAQCGRAAFYESAPSLMLRRLTASN
jgi:hypothetical protein